MSKRLIAILGLILIACLFLLVGWLSGPNGFAFIASILGLCVVAPIFAWCIEHAGDRR